MSTSSPDAGRYCLTLACRSARGQVASVTALLERHGAYIEEFAVFDDVLSQRFYEGLLFHHLPVTPETKAQQEAQLLRCIHEHGAELVVLARYMQVPSTSTTPSCPDSRAPGPMRKPMPAASS